jgi:Na+/H+ antiporter 1
MPFRRSAHQVRRVLDPVVEFLRIEAVGGAVLLAATIAALVVANSPVADSYQRLWLQELTVAGLQWELRHWVNDALMTIFFLVIGLEVKRELTIGRLRDPRRATLPILAALAGRRSRPWSSWPSTPAARRPGAGPSPWPPTPPSPSGSWPCWVPGSRPAPRRSCWRWPWSTTSPPSR